MARWPLLATAVVLGLATLLVYAIRLTEPLAITPWEPAIALEAMRFKAGLPLYEPGHATHLYGPLLSVVLAGIFSLTEFNLLAARAAFSVGALGLVGFATYVVCRGNLRPHWVLGALLFLCINLRTNFVFLSTQPDCLAALLALGGLSAWSAARRSPGRLVLALGLFLLAMLLKQTSAAFALVPIARVLLWKRPIRWSALAFAFLPAGFLLFSLSLILLLSPAIFNGMVLIPGALKVHYGRSFSTILLLLGTFPIFFLALLMMLNSTIRIAARERWICSSVVVLVPISIWTTIKSGGGYNSLLFAYLSMTALFVSQLDRIMTWIRLGSGGRSFLAASVVAVAILCSFLFQFEKAVPILLARNGDGKYDAAVDMARRLQGGVVVSPQDPTIAFRANGHFGRSLYFELDSHSVNGEWPTGLPAEIEAELQGSRYLIETKSYVPSPLTPDVLTLNGFRPVPVPELQNSAYTLWAKRS